MVNVSATRMDTVATVNLDTQAPNVNKTMTIPVNIIVKILLIHTSAAVILDTRWIHSDVLTLMSVKCDFGQCIMKRDLLDVNVTQDTIRIQ